MDSIYTDDGDGLVDVEHGKVPFFSFQFCYLSRWYCGVEVVVEITDNTPDHKVPFSHCRERACLNMFNLWMIAC